MLKKLLIIILRVLSHIKEAEIVSLSYELAYKLLLAIFPFLIFIMSLIAYFNLDGLRWIESSRAILPAEIIKIIEVFVHEVILTKQMNILSTSLIITVYSASSGFFTVIKCLNKSYDVIETRRHILIRLQSVFLVILLALAILLTMSVSVFGDKIWLLIEKYNIIPFSLKNLYQILQYSIYAVVLIIIISFLYKYSVNKKITYVSVLPGAAFTVVFWIVVSKIFNIYINNFSKYSVIYGSIGSIFILLIWLFLISIILLLGGSLNATFALKRKSTIK